jgi:hypothetical protein
MTEAETQYHAIASVMLGSLRSQLFGKQCYKLDGKPYVCFFEDRMVFKIKGQTHERALQLDSSCLFDPSGKKRPMKEWVQVNVSYFH